MLRDALRRPRFGWLVGSLVVLAGLAAVGSCARLSADPERLWKAAQVDVAAGRLDDARAKLDRISAIRRPTPADAMLRAQVALAQGKPDEAVENLHRVPDGHPLAPLARLREGQAELRRWRGRAAEAALLQAIKLEPKLVQAHRELVYLYGMQLRRKELAEQFRQLSELTPLTFNHVFTWCLTRGCVWEPAEVAGDLEKFVKADPGDRDSRLSLVESLRQLGRLDDADARLAALPTSDPDARAARARIALDRGDETAARALLAEGPADHPALALLRGRIAFAHRDGPEAVRQLRLAHAADPDSRDALFLLGQALRMTGRADEAKPYLTAARDQDALGTLIQRAASQVDRNDPKLPLLLGRACETLGRDPEARAWYKLAIARDSLDREAQAALYRLNTRAGAARTR